MINVIQLDNMDALLDAIRRSGSADAIVPTPTQADNGKFLIAQDGTCVWQSLDPVLKDDIFVNNEMLNFDI